MSVLVGGLGYRNLSDHSIGIMISDLLAERSWPTGMGVEDVSYNPIAVVQRMHDNPPGRMVIVAAISRPGREPGMVEAYRWDKALPSDALIQRAVTDAVTGVILLDNTLVVGEHFGGWPAEVAVVEVEPVLEEFGDELSPKVAQKFDAVCDLVVRLAMDRAEAEGLPMTPLGFGRGMLGASL
ncbi:MAG: hypothetical protein ABIR28_05540 [Vicinamibacteria bacterium]